METSGMFVGKRELNREMRPIWLWFDCYLTPQRYHLKRTRLNYQLQFSMRPSASRLNSRDRRKSSLKTDTREFSILFYFLRVHFDT